MCVEDKDKDFFNVIEKFSVGDVLGLSFRNKGFTYFFEGLCIAIKGKSFLSPETKVIVRNILSDVGIELNFSFFYNRAFFLKNNSFKRKRVFYSRAKLYYVRHKLNRESRIL